METVQIFRDKKELPKGTKIIDTVERSLRELCVVRHPELKSLSPEIANARFKSFLQEINIEPIYAYYPWKKLAVLMMPEDIYFELRTARNRNIITKEEQEIYHNATVGIIGLSVGFNVVSALVFSGGPRRLKIADYDVIDATNLNRLRAPVWALGMNKAEFAAQEIWGLDPFAKLELWEQGVSKDTLEKFIIGDPKLDIFIDEMDSLDLKFLSRILCRTHGIPVVMATDNGDNVILDVERFDEEPDRKFFHGLGEEVNPDTLSNLSYAKWVEVAVKIVDPKNLTLRMQESLREIGKTIAAVPQLGTTATLAGVAAAYAVRKIVNREPMSSGRYFVTLESLGGSG